MSLKSKVEAVLFITARAAQPDEIAAILNEPVDEVEEALLDLIMDYASREGALEIDDENGYIIQVREEYMDIVEKLVPVELTPAILKTLSIIAIKEPVLQTELIDLRGSSAYEHIKELLIKGLITRRRDAATHSFRIKTTDKFAEYFKLKGDEASLAQFMAEKKKLTQGDIIVDQQELEIEKDLLNVDLIED
ncbi:MAG: SMC-Scp complex subunit ScpB [Candidatus Gastranaerophilales bacterium]|jgi:segregation and condensation protein B|nr:SMC-Scp complex subunit ScpB [Candidatus Gastranaerophilales bacterium]